MRTAIAILLLAESVLSFRAVAENPSIKPADLWRAQHLIIDLHQHIDCTTQRLSRAVKIMDASGVGIVVNLTAGTVTPAANGGPSEFEQNKTLAYTLYPG